MQSVFQTLVTFTTCCIRQIKVSNDVKLSHLNSKIFIFLDTNKYGVNLIGQNDKHCASYDNEHNNEPYRWSEILNSIILCTFIILCISACYYENRFLRFFSIKRNLKKIYKIPDDYDTNVYNFIHGVKAIYVALSAACHACAVLYLFSPSLYGMFELSLFFNLIFNF